MKYQVRIRDFMSDKPASELLDTFAEASEKLPDPDMAYIFTNYKAK